MANREEVQQEILVAAERLAKATGPAGQRDYDSVYAQRVLELVQAWAILQTPKGKGGQFMSF